MSVIATIMSFAYSFIGMGLSIAMATSEPTCVQAVLPDHQILSPLRAFGWHYMWTSRSQPAVSACLLEWWF